MEIKDDKSDDILSEGKTNDKLLQEKLGFTKQDEPLVMPCPHCKIYVIIFKKEINCAIFRHGVFKNNLKQMNPHESKVNCDKFVKENLIYGCGKPFKLEKKIIDKSEYYRLVICDYI